MDTVDRVRENTSEEVNRDLDRETAGRVASFAAAGGRAISQRLEELDREWDMERVLETNASSIMLGSLALAAAHDRRWLALTGVVAGFLLQHALQGWCPPVPLFRRLGVRTRSEIEQERYALKAARGDFAEVRGPSGSERARLALEAVRL